MRGVSSPRSSRGVRTTTMPCEWRISTARHSKTGRTLRAYEFRYSRDVMRHCKFIRSRVAAVLMRESAQSTLPFSRARTMPGAALYPGAAALFHGIGLSGKYRTTLYSLRLSGRLIASDFRSLPRTSTSEERIVKQAIFAATSLIGTRPWYPMTPRLPPGHGVPCFLHHYMGRTSTIRVGAL